MKQFYYCARCAEKLLDASPNQSSEVFLLPCQKCEIEVQNQITARNVYDNDTLTYSDVKRQAREIQDACNPIAVCNFLVGAMKAVNKEVKGYDAMRQDLYLKAIIGKLADLFHISHDGAVYDVLSQDDQARLLTGGINPTAKE